MKNDTRVQGTTDLLCPYAAKYVSGPRGQMGQQQYQQGLTPQNAITGEPMSDHCQTLTGYERQMADYTFKVEMPCDATIHYVGTRFKVTTKDEHNKFKMTRGSFFLLFQNMDVDGNGEWDYIEIPRYHKSHELFGFKYIWTDFANRLKEGSCQISIKKGTLLAHSPNVDMKTGMYRAGKSYMTANLGLAGTTEDGMIVSEEMLEESAPIAIKSNSGSWGKKSYPVNTYGDKDVYMPFGKPGMRLRDDNLVMAIRRIDPNFDCINMLPEALCEVDYITDERIHAVEETEGAIIHDVRIISNISDGNRNSTTTSTEMEKMPTELVNQNLRFADDILKLHDEVICRRGRKDNMSLRLQSFLVDILAERPNHPSRAPKTKGSPVNNGPVNRVIKNKPLDEWFVEVTYSWQWKLGLGAKLADRSGCKGTVCQILPRADMPRDEFGNVCDVVRFGSAMVHRLIAAPEVARFVASSAATARLDIVAATEAGDYQSAIAVLTTWLGIIGHDHLRMFNELSDDDKRAQIDMIVEGKLHLILPPDNDYCNKFNLRKLEEQFPPRKGKVTWNNYGRETTSYKDVLIGEVQMNFLEKVSFKPMSAFIARQQHHGLPATNNKSTKVSAQIVKNPARVDGESEQRHHYNLLGPEALNDMSDMANNPAVIRDGVAKMFNYSKTNSREFWNTPIVDRTVHRPGQGRNILFFKHLLEFMSLSIEDQ